MTTPVPSEVTVATGVEQVRDNAQALGLQWGLKFATVVSVDPNDNSVIMITLDGATTTTVPALSLTGSLAPGNRVCVIEVPPSGLYVVNKVPGNFYEARQTLTSSAASVTFSDIPANLRRLDVHLTARTTGAVNANQVYYRINGNSSAVYFAERLTGNNATAGATPDNGLTMGPIGLLTGSLAAANVFGSGQATFVSWDSPNSGSLSYTYNSQALGTGVANFFTFTGGGIYYADGPYTSITFIPQVGSFESGSDFQITGWYA